MARRGTEGYVAGIAICLALFVGYMYEGLRQSQQQAYAKLPKSFTRKTLSELSSSLVADSDSDTPVSVISDNIECPPGFQPQLDKQSAVEPIENAEAEFYAGKQVWCVSDAGTALHWCAFTETALDDKQRDECVKQGYVTMSGGYLQTSDKKEYLQAMVFNMNNAYSAQRRDFLNCPKEWQPKDESHSSALLVDFDDFSTMEDVINAHIDDAAICCKAVEGDSDAEQRECKHWCAITEKMSTLNHAMYLKCLGYLSHKTDAQINEALHFEHSLKSATAVFQVAGQSQGQRQTVSSEAADMGTTAQMPQNATVIVKNATTETGVVANGTEIETGVGKTQMPQTTTEMGTTVSVESGAAANGSESKKSYPTPEPVDTDTGFFSPIVIFAMCHAAFAMLIFVCLFCSKSKKEKGEELQSSIER